MHQTFKDSRSKQCFFVGWCSGSFFEQATIYIAVSHKFKLCSEFSIVIDVESHDENTTEALPRLDATLANDFEPKQVCSADQ